MLFDPLNDPRPASAGAEKLKETLGGVRRAIGRYIRAALLVAFLIALLAAYAAGFSEGLNS